MAVPFAWAGSDGAPSSLLVVSTTSDAVNGAVTSPAALIARPGSDGISLREAIMAANHAVGFQAITFSTSLAGETITPNGSLPSLTHEDTALVGPTAPDGQPTVTLDGAKVAIDGTGLLSVLASNTSISHLRIGGLTGPDIPGIVILAGGRGGEKNVDHVLVDWNVLDNSGAPGTALVIGTPYGPSPAVGAALSDVTVAHNTIEGFTGDGINVAMPGIDCTLSGLTIEQNAFVDDTGPANPALEIGSNYSGNTTSGTTIAKNTFTGDTTALYIDGGLAMVNQGNGSLIPATGNTVSDTLISQNVFDGDRNSLQFVGGLGSSHATGNSIQDVEVSNDVIVNSTSLSTTAVYVFGGEDGATGNSVRDLHFVNDTIASNAGGAVWLDDGGLGNQISGAEIQNTVFWANGGVDFAGPTAGVVTSETSLIGTDPRFVGAGDFDLQAGSPAIDAGTEAGAPLYDADDRARVGGPDIGAYEFSAAPRPTFDVGVEELGGSGTVSSSPAGIACAPACDAAFDANTRVTLSASPAPESRFTGWTGACSGIRPCTVTLSASLAAVATFAPAGPKRVAKCGSRVLCPRRLLPSSG